jgi:hypothetical protein
LGVNNHNNWEDWKKLIIDRQFPLQIADYYMQIYNLNPDFIKPKEELIVYETENEKYRYKRLSLVIKRKDNKYSPFLEAWTEHDKKFASGTMDSDYLVNLFYKKITKLERGNYE